MARKRNIETEAKIATAATALFCTQGYVDTTMAAIAQEAGVSVQTLYLRHGSKAAVLSAALDVAIAGDATPVSLPEREDDFFARAREAPDAAAAVAAVVHGARRICDRTHRLYDAIRSAAADPEVRQVLDKNRGERQSGLLMLADAVATKKRYDPGVPAQRTADLLYTLGTEDAYLLFVVDCGWSVDDWERWVIDTISGQIVRRPRSGGPSSGSLLR